MVQRLPGRRHRDGHSRETDQEQNRFVCEPKTTDRYGRTVAICRANGEDLGRAMVQLGMASAFTRYSADYVQDEAKAKAARLGVHAHECTPPWEWRAQHR
jgi:endonuclease YncB( thermonuclease family)